MTTCQKCYDSGKFLKQKSQACADICAMCIQSFSQLYLAIPEKTPSLLNWIHPSILNWIECTLYIKRPPIFKLCSNKISMVVKQFFLVFWQSKPTCLSFSCQRKCKDYDEFDAHIWVTFVCFEQQGWWVNNVHQT